MENLKARATFEGFDLRTGLKREFEYNLIINQKGRESIKVQCMDRIIYYANIIDFLLDWNNVKTM